MSPRALKTTKISRKPPLQRVIFVPFLLQILSIVVPIGWLSFHNSRKAVNEIASQLRREIASRIEAEVRPFLETPFKINQINARAIARQGIDTSEVRNLEELYWDRLRTFPQVTGIGFGEESQGHVIAVFAKGEKEEKQFFVEYANAQTEGKYTQKQVNKRRESVGNLQTFEKIDIRKRPWYEATKKKKVPNWSPIYISVSKSFKKNSLAITAAHPIYRNQKLLGVTTVILNLKHISNVLKELEISKSGQAYIIERTGELIGSSDGKEPIKKANAIEEEEPEQLLASESGNLLIRESFAYLRQKHGGDALEGIEEAVSYEFEIDGEGKQFLKVIPLCQDLKLDWLIVVVVPERDFMEQINRNTFMTVCLCCAALALAAGLGILTSGWVTRPILKLSEASQKLADGELDERVAISGTRELEVLARSFNRMAHQLKTSFHNLERRVEQRTKELKKAKQAADVANQAKSAFLANMSHELRTPLNGILGYAQILQYDREINSQQRDRVNIIHQCGKHLLSLINDILDLSKIEAQKMELYSQAFDLRAFLTAVAEIFQVKAEKKGIGFQCKFSDRLPEIICADEKRLRQVLLNLLGNAIEFTDCGKIAFRARVASDGSTPKPIPKPSGAMPVTRIQFQVEDTGIGIGRDRLQKIFLPFEQVGDRDRPSKGTGLGLAISQKIVRLMGSNLIVESEIGRGSTFSFAIDVPVADRLEVAGPENATNRAIVGFKGCNTIKVLIVDDRWENRAVVRDFLAPIGFETSEAKDGCEGLQQAIAHKPDLIITDLVMPEMHGFEMVKQIRERPEFANTIIITSSASVFEADKHKSLNAGSNDFLPKTRTSKRAIGYAKKAFGCGMDLRVGRDKFFFRQKKTSRNQRKYPILPRKSSPLLAIDSLPYMRLLLSEIFEVFKMQLTAFNKWAVSTFPLPEKYSSWPNSSMMKALSIFSTSISLKSN